MKANSTLPEQRAEREASVAPKEQPDAEGLLIPGSPSPLSPGRVTVNPDNEAGVDELPDNERAAAHGRDAAGLADMRDIDVDKAEMDGQPNPR